MKKNATLGAILLFVLTPLCRGFEPYHYKDVPFPETMGSPELQFMALVETLTDFAAIEEIPDQNRAKLLAAARRIAPLNKRTFSLEYQLSIGEKPSQPSKMPLEIVRQMLFPHLQHLKATPGTEEFVAFLNEATDFDAPAKNETTPITKTPAGPDPFAGESAGASTASTNSCGLLSIKGCTKLRSESRIIDGRTFQFGPGNLKSNIFLSAYREAIKFLALSSATGLEGKRIDFFANKEMSPKDGPAGALGCAVLTKAVADNFKTDPNVAFAGDVNADGTVQPLDDQRERLIADPDSLYKIIVIPKGDRFAADDLLLLHGPAVFYKTQLLEVTTLEEAVDIAKLDKDEHLQKSLTAFAAIQKVLNQKNGKKFITNGHVRKRLKGILDATPSHISAYQLYQASQKRYPAYLSLDGSLELIFDALDPVIEDGEIDAYGKLDPEAFKLLKRYRNRLDPELKNLASATITFETSGRLGDSQNERARVKQNLKEEISAMSRNVKIREKMM